MKRPPSETDSQNRSRLAWRFLMPFSGSEADELTAPQTETPADSVDPRPLSAQRLTEMKQICILNYDASRLKLIQAYERLCEIAWIFAPDAASAMAQEARLQHMLLAELNQSLSDASD